MIKLLNKPTAWQKRICVYLIASFVLVACASTSAFKLSNAVDFEVTRAKLELDATARRVFLEDCRGDLGANAVNTTEYLMASDIEFFGLADLSQNESVSVFCARYLKWFMADSREFEDYLELTAGTPASMQRMLEVMTKLEMPAIQFGKIPRDQVMDRETFEAVKFYVLGSYVRAANPVIPRSIISGCSQTMAKVLEPGMSEAQYIKISFGYAEMPNNEAAESICNDVLKAFWAEKVDFEDLFQVVAQNSFGELAHAVR